MLTERIRARVLLSLLLICCSLPVTAQSKKKAAAPDANGPFTTDTAVRLLNQLVSSLETHNQAQFLSAFDSEFMAKYGQFSDQTEVFFTQYDNFVARFQVLESGGNENQPLVLVQFSIEAHPVTFGANLSKSAQVRFEFVRGKNGWKIVNVTPRGFFSS